MAKTVQVVIADDTYKKLKAITEKEFRTMSQWCYLAINAELKRRESGKSGS